MSASDLRHWCRSVLRRTSQKQLFRQKTCNNVVKHFVNAHFVFFSCVFTGLLVWFFARDAYHIGLSGVIYSLLFFLFFSGVFRKDTRLLTVALLVVFIYGSMVWGIFPYDWRISFESHLSGSIVGLFLSIIFKKQKASFKKVKTQWEIEEELGIESDNLDGLWEIDDEE